MYIANPKKIMRPWTPVAASEENNCCKIGVWGREYTASGTPMLSSIISQNQELLAGPIRIVATENGKDIAFENAKCFLMDEVTPESAAFCCGAEAEDLIVDTTCKVEYDGFMNWTLSVMPQGLSVAAACGVKEDEVYACNLTRFWMEIPLDAKKFDYYSFAPTVKYRADGVEQEATTLIRAGMIPNHLEFPFCYQLYLSGENTGLAFLCESNEHWQSAQYPIEVLRKDNEIVLRIRFLDWEPEYWQGIPEKDRLHMEPLTFRFAMITTPVKPLPKDPYAERSLHIDCGHKVLNNYEEYLFDNFVDTGEYTGIPPEGTAIQYDEMTFDRIERLGVKVLYLHEKWNTIQNSPYITRQSAQRLHKIVEEAHSRGIKVIPYFGYEISTLAPYWGEYGLQFNQRENGTHPAWWHWYRQPPQRDLTVCYNDPRLRKLFVSGIRKLVETFDFDGLYLDGTVDRRGCRNEAHGCGWRDSSGNLHPTHSLLGIRELMKELYAIFDPREGIINCHTGMEFNFAAISFYHSIWDGEVIQIPFLNGLIHEIPEGFMRASFNFRSIGLPFYMLCYANAPKWDFRRALSLSLLLGLMPKPNNAGTPLEAMGKLWKILDYIPIERAVWHPFYENSGIATVSDPAVKFSYYEYTDITGRICRLFFCANTHDTPSEAVISFRDGPAVFRNLFGTEMIQTENGFQVRYENFDCTVFYTETER